MRYLMLVLLVGLACSSPGTQPPLPSPPGIARVELVADSGTVFVGRAVPGQRLVARVVDSAGNIVTNAVLSAETSPGWTIRGDTIIAPATEGTGGVRIIATRPGPRPTAGRLGAADITPDSAVSTEITLGIVVDLAALNMTMTTLTCRALPGNTLSNDSIGPIDSLVFPAPIVDSTVYAGGEVFGPEGYLLGFYGFAAVVTIRDDNGIMYGARGSLPYGMYIHPGITKQIPDTLVFPGDTKVARVSKVTPSYDMNGRMYCDLVAPGPWDASDVTMAAK